MPAISVTFPEMWLWALNHLLLLGVNCTLIKGPQEGVPVASFRSSMGSWGQCEALKTNVTFFRSCFFFFFFWRSWFVQWSQHWDMGKQYYFALNSYIPWVNGQYWGPFAWEPVEKMEQYHCQEEPRMCCPLSPFFLQCVLMSPPSAGVNTIPPSLPKKTRLWHL